MIQICPMGMSEQSSKDLIFYSHRMDLKGWAANHDGNLSLKISENEFLATPTARSKFSLEEKDLVVIDREGKVVQTGPQQVTGKVFSEWKIHSFIYEKRRDVAAVVHAHSPYAMAASLCEQEMLTGAIPEAVVSLGLGVPVVPLSLPGSEKSMEELSRLLPHYDAVLIGGNGVFTWGRNIEQAFLRLELVEQLAKIFSKAIALGVAKQLDSESIKELLKKRSEAGLALPSDPARSHWHP